MKNQTDNSAPPVPLSRLVRLWRRFVAWANQPTNNTGPGSKVPDETVLLLRSIDARLKTLESCVKPGVRHKPHTSHIVTGHWND
jgi:hypothetical protein